VSNRNLPGGMFLAWLAREQMGLEEKTKTGGKQCQLSQ
jgi:hypothetical protein